MKIYNDWIEEMEEKIQKRRGNESISSFFGRISGSVLKIAGLFALGSKDIINIINIINTSHNSQIQNNVSELTCESVNFVNFRKELEIKEPEIETAIFYARNYFIPSFFILSMASLSSFIILSGDFSSFIFISPSILSFDNSGGNVTKSWFKSQILK